MLILLPPSEGKTRASSSENYDDAALSFPQLSSARSEVLEALHEVSLHPEAAKILGVGKSLSTEIVRNTVLRTEPTAPAHDVYSGVLYDALDYPSLTKVQQEKARRSVVVISALWGAVHLGDPIPAYRLSMGTNLPTLGPLSTWWKARLAPALNPLVGEQLVIDCRSSSYQKAWIPPHAQTVEVNVFEERNGNRTVVSHFAKHTRGELARFLVQKRSAEPLTAQDLLRQVKTRWNAELVEATPKKSHQLNIILHPLTPDCQR